ncbi:MAG: glucose 1-dehydrogenase [Chloroflexi bacterium]|nr:glucose 1-dehydrogenase [Chloroflexota bacterium]
MEQRLAGKVAVVTGAGQGIGQGVALRLAGEGADLVIAEFNPQTATTVAQQIAALGRRALAYPIDIGDVSAVRQMVATVAEEFGRIDILVNNAGITQTIPMLDLAETDWDTIHTVNQRGLFFCLQAVALQMVRQIPDEVKAAGRAGRSYGKIVNLSSISGRRGRPLAAHYAATKAAVISITQSAALALAPYNINVNAVCPSVVPTPMWQQIDLDRGRLFGMKPGEAQAAFIENIPLKRAATPEDIAGAIAFFCSADADYITGQTLNVDGGFEMD